MIITENVFGTLDTWYN